MLDETEKRCPNLIVCGGVFVLEKPKLDAPVLVVPERFFDPIYAERSSRVICRVRLDSGERR
jgi:hypothetical protein